MNVKIQITSSSLRKHQTLKIYTNKHHELKFWQLGYRHVTRARLNEHPNLTLSELYLTYVTFSPRLYFGLHVCNFFTEKKTYVLFRLLFSEMFVYVFVCPATDGVCAKRLRWVLKRRRDRLRTRGLARPADDLTSTGETTS